MAEPTRIDEIADRFWEDYLELTPTTATVYGDDRYDDRLDDPGPAGRAAARALAERVGREARRVPADGLSVEDRITRDMLGVVADLAIEEDDHAFHELASSTRSTAPQTAAPAARSSSRPTPRSGSTACSRASTPTGRSWPPTSRSCARAWRPA